MGDCTNGGGTQGNVEVRFFGNLKKAADEKGLSFPCYIGLEKDCTAIELVERLGLPTDNIEAVFIDGFARPIDGAIVKPGSRVGYIPYGVPGPYRVLLGIREIKNKEN